MWCMVRKDERVARELDPPRCSWGTVRSRTPPGAQARREEAILKNEETVAATRDYSNLFYMFGVDFYVEMLTDIGLPEGLADLLRGLCGDCILHIKVAGSYGGELVPTNGMDQGCSLTLLAANATVTIEFNMLENTTPVAMHLWPRSL